MNYYPNFMKNYLILENETNKSLDRKIVKLDSPKENLQNNETNRNTNPLCDNDEDDKDDDEKGENIRQNKGLKILSIIVKEIVREKKTTTYKEVAEVIIRENLRFQNRGIVDSEKYKKAEQNIKRRVYDALNVLISASILKKERKQVRINEDNKRICINEKRSKSNILNSEIVSVTRSKKLFRLKKSKLVSKIFSQK